ncbi:DUF1205 domain-containing protein [Streptomyces chumphonensis]|uniref:DUF1205 domain-containing protein n=2 Tax=Streptomyces chumphonensis TaxID=1214925 RepID=A0A927EXX1_9ACTN|nr:DUF1205 domain-containing protein [Streptomyces chumphonensis]
MHLALGLHEARGVEEAKASDLAHRLRAGGPNFRTRFTATISVMPRSISQQGAEPTLPMRHIICGTQQLVEPWMHLKGDRPRVLFVLPETDGVSAAHHHTTRLIKAAAHLDVELLIASTSGPDEFSGFLPLDARVGRFPVAALIATCDAVAHSADAATALDCMAAGVPQIVLPAGGSRAHRNAVVPTYGGALQLHSGHEHRGLAEVVRSALEDSVVRGAARRLRLEVESMPPPASLVAMLEQSAVSPVDERTARIG